MKKHITIILMLVLILSAIGVSIWLVVKHNNIKPLYNANSEFIFSEDVKTLDTNISKAEQLYFQKTSNRETRLSTLNLTINTLNDLEKDLNTYLLLSNVKPSSTRKISKAYKKLSKERIALIKNYEEFTTRMQGNTSIDGPACQNLYNEIFTKTVNFIYNYNSVFSKTHEHVFAKVYKSETIKISLYSLYSESITSLLNNISNNQFKTINFIKALSNSIVLNEFGNIEIKSDIVGGEYGNESNMFKKYFKQSDLKNLVNEFEKYFAANTKPIINPNTETSNEKLTIYYGLKILNFEV